VILVLHCRHEVSYGLLVKKLLLSTSIHFFRNVRHIYISLPSNSHYTIVALVVDDRVAAVAAVPVAANTGLRGRFVRRGDRSAEAGRRSKGPFGRERQCGHRHHDPVAVTIGHDGYLRGPVLGGPNWVMKS
jgi:hypothetical protein